jgi:alpha-1,6-mannosyltransferase
MHVVDATLFYSPTSGGVKRYLTAKHEWMRTHTSWRHSLLVPGESRTHVPGEISTVAGGLVPGAFNYRLPLNPLRWSRAIDALEPDLIEVGDVFHPAWAAASIAQRRGIPLIAFYHSNFPQLAGRRLGRTVQKFLEWYVRLTYARCERVLAPSRYMCEYLYSIGVEHATTQPLGVDVDTFSPQRRRDLRAELGLSGDVRLLLFAGRFSAEKNIPVLEETFRRLGDRYHLLLVGGAESGRAGNVTRIPYRRDNVELAEYMASADALVHAGVHETFGLVVLEAMACGRPVVAMRAGALPEFVDESRGVLAEPHTVKSAENLAEAVVSLYERDPEALGAAARSHVVTNYRWSRTLRGLMEHYQQALVKSSRTTSADSPEPTSCLRAPSPGEAARRSG